MSQAVRRRILQYIADNGNTNTIALAQHIGVTEIQIKRQLDILGDDKLIELARSIGRTQEKQRYAILGITPQGWKALEVESQESISVDQQAASKIELSSSIAPLQSFLYDVFLSYASADHIEANLLYEAINTAGGRIFLAAKTLKAGDDFAEKIRKALWVSRELWLLVSPNSLKSDWVISEWGAAWVLQKRIIPILHRCRPEDLPDRIRRLHCIDFYRYTDLIKDSFQK